MLGLICLTAALVLISVAPSANASSLATFQAEGLPIPSWVTDVTGPLGCTFQDSNDENAAGLFIYITCSRNFTADECSANIRNKFDALSQPTPDSESSPGGYKFSTFSCTAAAPGANPPGKCSEREANFFFDSDLQAWVGTDDTGWGPSLYPDNSCVLKPVPAKFKIKNVSVDDQGKARVNIHVASDGRLTLIGPGVRKVTKTPQGAGTVALPVATTGAKRRALDRDGHVRVKVKVSFSTATDRTKRSTTIELHK